MHVKFRVGSMRASKSRPDWGIVVLPSELINQHGEVVQHGRASSDGAAPPETERCGVQA